MAEGVSTRTKHIRSCVRDEDDAGEEQGVGRDIFATFIDMEKAFDRVPRELLWKIMRNLVVEKRQICSLS